MPMSSSGLPHTAPSAICETCHVAGLQQNQYRISGPKLYFMLHKLGSFPLKEWNCGFSSKDTQQSQWCHLFKNRLGRDQIYRELIQFMPRMTTVMQEWKAIFCLFKSASWHLEVRCNKLVFGSDIFCDNKVVIQGGDHLVYLQLPKHSLSSQTMPSAASTATVE